MTATPAAERGGFRLRRSKLGVFSEKTLTGGGGVRFSAGSGGGLDVSGWPNSPISG
ncbi:hypothetical protein Ae406Ps2_6232 [Pseudonocardia sp. Ae406_Ps2]|nr:hypothetical protein Ae406Ps2_6232 [Pseudonocardia sp. Ae406_Ps2]